MPATEVEEPHPSLPGPRGGGPGGGFRTENFDFIVLRAPALDSIGSGCFVKTKSKTFSRLASNDLAVGGSPVAVGGSMEMSQNHEKS